MTTIMDTNHFPNILLYGPPGTGKTTTIINLVNCFQERNNEKNKGLMIHLNASDERGIDVIRNQIHQFVNSKSLFTTGTKFVILDEVDYMTKSAQQALKYLLQGFMKNVRFCLICNYISRIDESLQNAFMRLRFSQLPESDIIRFLTVISEQERLFIPQEKLAMIQKLYKSDIRSMINYMQSNQNVILNQKVIDNTVWDALTDLIETPSLTDQLSYEAAVTKLDAISTLYNIEPRNLIKNYIKYIISCKGDRLNAAFLNLVENVIHLTEPNVDYVTRYLVLALRDLYAPRSLCTTNTLCATYTL